MISGMKEGAIIRPETLIGNDPIDTESGYPK